MKLALKEFRLFLTQIPMTCRDFPAEILASHGALVVKFIHGLCLPLTRAYTPMSGTGVIPNFVRSGILLPRTVLCGPLPGLRWFPQTHAVISTRLETQWKHLQISSVLSAKCCSFQYSDAHASPFPRLLAQEDGGLHLHPLSCSPP